MTEKNIFHGHGAVNAIERKFRMINHIFFLVPAHILNLSFECKAEFLA